MLRKIYVDNFKSLSNFDWTPDYFTTLLGENGTGKSSVFECIRNIRNFIRGENISAIFHPQTLTRWQKQNTQTFSMDIAGLDGIFTYTLITEFTLSRDRVRVQQERLQFNGSPLFEMKVEGKNCEAQLYHDDFSKGPVYPFNWNLSGLSTIQERPDNQKLSWFKHYMDSLLILKINPYTMDTESSEENSILKDDASNFLDWYRYLSQEYQGELYDLFTAFADIFPGFKSLKLEKTGTFSKNLQFVGENQVMFDFNELSEGQKVLLVLYSLLYLRGSDPTTILLDEPDNFVAIREIQPLLFKLTELVEDGKLQVLLISHSSEVMNFLGTSTGYHVYRTFDSPTRIVRLSQKILNSQLPVSELMARGWAE